ncbi:MAG: hypothetical protein FWE03_02295 [Firmicutes bacterium]|nr:hypothetical protein [Bacillota bacterium]
MEGLTIIIIAIVAAIIAIIPLSKNGKKKGRGVGFGEILAQNKLMKNNDYIEALTHYEELITRPGFINEPLEVQAGLLHSAALCYINTGFLDDAFKLIDQADKIKFIKQSTDYVKGEYYARLSFFNKDISLALQAESHYRKAAEHNPVYFNIITKMYIFHFEFEKALNAAEEFINTCKKSDLANGYTWLMKIHKLTGNIDGIRQVVKKVKQAKLKNILELENELKLLEEEDLKYFMATSNPLSHAFSSLIKLYQSQPNTIYDIWLFKKKIGLADFMIKPDYAENCVVGINFSHLPNEFKSKNNIPKEGTLFLDLSEETAKTFITQDNIASFWGDYFINFVQKQKCYTLSKYNSDKFEEAIGLKLDEIMQYYIFYYFINEYNDTTHTCIAKYTTETPDDKAANRIIRLNFNEFLIDILDEESNFEATGYSLLDDKLDDKKEHLNV